MRQLADEISIKQLHAWMAYYELEPFGEQRDDLRMAQLLALTANVNRDPKKRHKPYTAMDFMPDFEEAADRKPRTPETVWQDLKRKVKLTMGKLRGSKKT